MKMRVPAGHARGLIRQWIAGLAAPSCSSMVVVRRGDAANASRAIDRRM